MWHEPSSTQREDKIYLVTHSDLSVGHQITQTAHVIAELAVAHRERFHTWHDVSQSIIVLQTPTAESLIELYVRAKQENLTVQAFREPDLGDEITALAFLPSPGTVRFCANLPLAGKSLPEDSVRRTEATLKRISLNIQGTEEFQRGRVLRECYFAYMDHLEGRMNLHGNPLWDVPEYTDEQKTELLAAMPSVWVLDRALTFMYVNEKARSAYAHDERIACVFDQPETLPGWDVVMSTFNLKENF